MFQSTLMIFLSQARPKKTPRDSQQGIDSLGVSRGASEEGQVHIHGRGSLLGASNKQIGNPADGRESTSHFQDTTPNKHLGATGIPRPGEFLWQVHEQLINNTSSTVQVATERGSMAVETSSHCLLQLKITGLGGTPTVSEQQPHLEQGQEQVEEPRPQNTEPERLRQSTRVRHPPDRFQ